MRETLVKHVRVDEAAEPDAQSHPKLVFSMYLLEILFFAVGFALFIVGHGHGLGAMFGKKITAPGERLFLALVAATIASALAPFVMGIYLATKRNSTEICCACVVIMVNGSFLLAGCFAFVSIIISIAH